jgi:hypothetical protein
MIDDNYGAHRATKFAAVREKMQQLAEGLGPQLAGPDVAGAFLLSGVDAMIKAEGRERCAKYLRDLATHVEATNYSPP